MRKALVLAGLLLAALALALWLRFPIGVFLHSLGGPPGLLPKEAVAAEGRWFDDYYTVTEIDAETFAIGEPRYPGAVYSYLISGRERALLLDTGLPLRDIRAVVDSLTERPVTVLASHLHYDHVGNHERFERVAMPDLPELRARLEEEWFEPTRLQHMGYVEGHPPPRWRVDAWIPPGGRIELGGRALELLHTPGHTSESVSLWDAERALLFTGDTFYEGELWAFLPSSSLPDYLETAEALLERIPPGTRLLGAHRPEGEGLPELGREDLADLRDALVAIREGRAERRGLLPARYRVNERLSLHADLPWLQGWR